MKRFAGERSWDFDVTDQGWRCHMSNIMASIGKVQLSNFNKIAKKRRELAKHYVSRLSDCNSIKLMPLDYDSIVPHIFVVELLSTTQRDSIRKELSELGIQTGIHYQPNHRLTFFKDPEGKPLEVTDKIFKRLITLPLHLDLTKKDIDYVSESLMKLLP